MKSFNEWFENRVKSATGGIDEASGQLPPAQQFDNAFAIDKKLEEFGNNFDPTQVRALADYFYAVYKRKDKLRDENAGDYEELSGAAYDLVATIEQAEKDLFKVYNLHEKIKRIPFTHQ